MEIEKLLLPGWYGGALVVVVLVFFFFVLKCAIHLPIVVVVRR
jgi:hypothetical protein